MKTWLKQRGRMLDPHCAKILKILMTAALMAGFFALGFSLRGIRAGKDTVFWRSIVTTPEPGSCALCGNGNGERYHAPCLVRLATGEVGELQVYDPDPQQAGELAPIQGTGTFTFLRCAGLTGYRDTSRHISNFTLPKEREPIDPAHFCRSCRALLTGTSIDGYVLLDLYDLNRITPYPIVDGAQYTIRDYAVSISEQEGSDGLDVHVTGLLP